MFRGMSLLISIVMLVSLPLAVVGLAAHNLKFMLGLGIFGLMVAGGWFSVRAIEKSMVTKTPSAPRASVPSAGIAALKPGVPPGPISYRGGVHTVPEGYSTDGRPRA